MKYVLTIVAITVGLLLTQATSNPTSNSPRHVITDRSKQVELLTALPQIPYATQSPIVPPASSTPPSAATPQPVQVASVPQGCEAYRSLVGSYDWDATTMMAIMRAESGCDPNAISPPNYDGLRDYGLMQLHGMYILDPAANVSAAYTKWVSQGYHAWSTYNNGAYLKYL